MGLTLAIILAGFFRCLSFRCGLESLVVLCIGAEQCFRLDTYLKAEVKGEEIFILVYSGTYLLTHSSLEEHVLVIVSDVGYPHGY